MQLLQGTWERFQEGDDEAEITVTITGNSLHFHRDKNFWFETTITLPAGKDPKQLHATIKNCAPPKDPIGEVVKAIYKIEDGTLTLVTFVEETPESFEVEGQGDNHYELRKALPQKKNIEPPKTGAPTSETKAAANSTGDSNSLVGPDIARSPGKISGYSAWKNLILEGRELHPSLKTRLVDEPILHMRSGMLLPRNPYTSTDAKFVAGVSGTTSMGKTRSREGVRSALYASYADEKKLVLLRGLEAASALDADRREVALRKTWAVNARGGRVQVHRKGLLLVVVWHDGISPEVWAAVNASVVERLGAPGPSSDE